MQKIMCLIGLALVPVSLLAAEEIRQIPNEYESVGGNGLAFGEGSVVATGGAAAIRANPAMLAMEREYTLAAGYHWPVGGRDFYQFGVVDSKTSATAAGFSYTSFSDDYKNSADNRELFADSPIDKRFTLGLAQMYKQGALGIGGSYISAYRDSVHSVDLNRLEKISGSTLNMGLVFLASPTTRIGASAENLANKKVRDYAPATYRVGASYLITPQFTTHLNYRQRERVAMFEGSPPQSVFGLTAAEANQIEKTNAKYADDEKMVFASFTAQAYDFFRIIGSYGQAVSKDARSSLSGGVAVVNKDVTLAYMTSKPYGQNADAQQAINLSFGISL